MADVSTAKKFLDLDGLTRFKGKILEAVVTSVNGRKGGVTLTKADVGLNNVTNDSQVKASEKGKAGGVATLDSAGKVPSSQLPSYVDDVLEYDNKAAFPATGETGKIYVDKATNKTYRWGGSTWINITNPIALGETSSDAYPGNKGKANADAIKALQTRATGIEEQIAGIMDDIATLDDREQQHAEGLATAIEEKGERISEIETWRSAISVTKQGNTTKPRLVMAGGTPTVTSAASNVAVKFATMSMADGAQGADATATLPAATSSVAGVMTAAQATMLGSVDAWVKKHNDNITALETFLASPISFTEIDALFA